MMEQVILLAVRPMENWLGSSLNQIQGWTTVQEPYSRALGQGSLTKNVQFNFERCKIWPINNSAVEVTNACSPAEGGVK